jgi:hypothetical protein
MGAKMNAYPHGGGRYDTCLMAMLLLPLHIVVSLITGRRFR